MLGINSLLFLVVVGFVSAIPIDPLSQMGLSLDEVKEDFEAYIVHKGGESRLTVIDKEGEHTVRFSEGFEVEKPENESVCLVRALAEGPLTDDDCIEKVPLRAQDVPESVLEECGSRPIFAVESCMQDPEKEKEMMEEKMPEEELENQQNEEQEMQGEGDLLEEEEAMKEQMLEEDRENQQKEEQEMQDEGDLLEEEQELLEEEEKEEQQQQTLPEEEDVLAEEGENEEEEGLLKQDKGDEETEEEEEEGQEQIVERAADHNSYDGLFHEPVDKRSVQLNAFDSTFNGKLDKRSLRLNSFEETFPGKIENRVVDNRINKRDAKIGYFD